MVTFLSDYRKTNTGSVYFMLFLQDKRDNPGFQNFRIKLDIKCKSQHIASTDVLIIISPYSLGGGVVRKYLDDWLSSLTSSCLLLRDPEVF